MILNIISTCIKISFLVKIYLEVMMVKKDNILAFFKGKSFYLSLLIGVCAIFAVAVVYISIVSNNKSNNLVDLNEPMDIASEQSENSLTDGNGISQAENSQSAEVASNTSQSIQDAAQLLNDSLLENDIVSEDEILANDTRNLINKAGANDPAESTAEVTDEADASTVTTINSSTLMFDEEKGLLWPMNGNVIKKYSMDELVYFETLNQYKTNPAILISGEVGTEVVSAATGIVKNIYKNDETGTTVVMSIGNDYVIEYGQLKNLKVKVGDTVEEGAMIGSIAEPTNYYVVEGSNLYFKVAQNDETVNPLLLLR